MRIKLALRTTLHIGILRKATALSILLVVASDAVAQQVPLIYSTDLFHPPDDPDDTVDLATVFALPELDLKAIILDLGQQQRKAPGAIPVRQMLALTGKRVPVATGLLHPLRYPEDTGEDQFGNSQGGVRLILKALRESEAKVTIITVGSVRDVAAAYNREPGLFKKKIRTIYVNAGNSGGGDLHWNPRLDPLAYVRLVQSDLPVRWAPSFDGRESFESLARGDWAARPHQAYWRFLQGEIYSQLPLALQNYFLYALAPKVASQDGPIAYLKRDRREEAVTERVWNEHRNMWSTLSIIDAAGRSFYRKADSWAALAEPEPGYEPAPIYEFVPTGVFLDRDLRTTLTAASAESKLRVLRILDLAVYPRAMQIALQRILSEFPLSEEFRQ